jgi:hypothetical protein
VYFLKIIQLEDIDILVVYSEVVSIGEFDYCCIATSTVC